METKALLSWQNRSTDDLDLLTTIFWSAGVSRHVLAERLAYSKSKANAMVASLLDEGVLDEVGLQDSSGGRRAETLQLSSSLGVLIGVDLGATSMQLAVLTPDLTVLARHAEAIDVRHGPGVVLARMRILMRELLARGGGAGAPGVGDWRAAP
jgi:hypothetical protein